MTREDKTPRADRILAITLVILALALIIRIASAVGTNAHPLTQSGDLVRYKLTAIDVSNIEQTCNYQPSYLNTPGALAPKQTYAAFVTRVWDHSQAANLQVFVDGRCSPYFLVSAPRENGQSLTQGHWQP